MLEMNTNKPIDLFYDLFTPLTVTKKPGHHPSGSPQDCQVGQTKNVKKTIKKRLTSTPGPCDSCPTFYFILLPWCHSCAPSPCWWRRTSSSATTSDRWCHLYLLWDAILLEEIGCNCPHSLTLSHLVWI